MAFRFFRRSSPFEFADAMVGVKMGERLLWVGAGTPDMFTALAAKVGLTGRAAAIVDNETDADRMRDAAARAGLLIEVFVERPSFPLENASFDVAIVDSTGGALKLIAPEWRVALIGDVRRLLRPGGRAMVIERAARGGLGALVSNATGAPLGPTTLLEVLRAEGFRPVRVLAEREGYLFVEGMRT